MPKPKPNGYSMFVVERCRRTQTPYQVGYARFAAEWKELGPAAQEAYKEKAKMEKVLIGKQEKEKELEVPMVIRPDHPLETTYSRRKEEQQRRQFQPFKRTHTECDEDDDIYADDEDHEPLVELNSASSISSATPPMKKVMVGDDAGFFTEIEVQPEQKDELEDDEMRELDLTKEQDLYDNVVDSYRDLNEMYNKHVFVVSCTPVIYAQGYKKGSNRPMNRPVEIALAAFSLHCGVDPTFYHSFVLPGKIPQHEHVHAFESRTERHGVPYADTVQEDQDSFQFHFNGFRLSRDYYGMYQTMLEMMGYHGNNETELPILLAPAETVRITESCFRWLYTEAQKQAVERKRKALPQLSFGSLNYFTIRALELKRTQEKNLNIAWRPEDLARTYAESTFHRQLHKMNCHFHAKYTTVKLCALGAAREASYVTLNILKEVYRFQKKEPWVFLGEGCEDSDDDE